MEIYLDHAATTWVYPQVADRITGILCGKFGNPSSMHMKGVQAEKYVKEAKERLAKMHDAGFNTFLLHNGDIFMDMLTYFERTADQCSSIAMLMLSKNNEDIMKNHHLYLQELHASGDQSYLAEQENRRLQYLVPLENMK